MKGKKWFVSLLLSLSLLLVAVNTGVTTSFYTDAELSTDDALGIRWGLTTLDDGFEGTPWDAYWDENGTTTWVQGSVQPHSGSYRAESDNTSNGYLTSDDFDAAGAENFSVSFWFKLKGLEAGDCLVQIYNGTTYNTWYDLLNYPTYVSNTWCQFSEVITDPQYFISGFRLRFDTSALVDGGEEVAIDDVYISTDSVPPAAPTNLVATPGVGQVSLDWDDNTETDLAGYNVYRSTTSGGPYTKVNVSLVATSDYIDTTVTELLTYYYVVTAVDLASNESGYSSEASATPVGITLLDDGFEGTPWDANWDDNGITTWVLHSRKVHNGSYSAMSDRKSSGYLTSDDLDASSAASIDVSFWFNPKNLDAGDLIIEIFNGSTWVTWYDITNYPTYAKKTWCYFGETITDPQYFVSNFRIRFNSSAIGSGETISIDDVLVVKN